MKVADSFTASFSKSSFESAMSNIGQFAGRVISYISERSSTSTVGAIFFASSVLAYLAYRSSSSRNESACSPKDSKGVSDVNEEDTQSIQSDDFNTPQDLENLIFTSTKLRKRTLTRRLHELGTSNADVLILKGRRITPDVINVVRNNASRFPKLKCLVLINTTVSAQKAAEILSEIKTWPTQTPKVIA